MYLEVVVDEKSQFLAEGTTDHGSDKQVGSIQATADSRASN
jgi:hypothetical protein